MSYVLPAGRYDRQEDEATGRDVVVAGTFHEVEQNPVGTGALRRSIGWLVRKLDGREVLVIPVIAVIFATGGVLENMQEEIIPLIPVLLILTRRVGLDALTAVSMSAGAAFVGSAFSPKNPFQINPGIGIPRQAA